MSLDASLQPARPRANKKAKPAPRAPRKPKSRPPGKQRFTPERIVPLTFPDRWLTRAEAAELLGLTERVLLDDGYKQLLRVPFYRFGPGRAPYRLSELIEWAETRKAHPNGGNGGPSG